MSFFGKRLLLLLAVLVIGAAFVTAGLKKLRLDPDILSTLPPDLPEVQSLRILRDAFAGGNELVMTLEAGDATVAQEATASLATTLRAQPDLCLGVQEGDAFENPGTAGAMLAWALQQGPPEHLRQLRSTLEGPDALNRHLERVFEELASSPDPGTVQRWQYDPLGLLQAVDFAKMVAMRDGSPGASSSDGTFRMLFLTPKEKLGGYREAERWLGEVDQVVARWRSSDAKYTNVLIRYTGEPAFMSEIGGGIERDLSGTLGVGTVLIAALYWFMHRRWKPLFWILLLMGLSILISLSLAGFVVGKITIMSLGFASIVLGIVVDYGVLILQEARDHPHFTVAQLRNSAMPGILAGAATTSAVFFALLFVGLPGLAELGLLVGINVVAGAGVMLAVMPYVAARGRRPRPATTMPDQAAKASSRYAVAGTALLAVGVGITFAWKGLPPFESGAAALRPSKSEAMKTWEIIQQRLGKSDEASVPQVLTGGPGGLWETAARAETALTAWQREGLIKGFSLPSPFLPAPGNARANRAVMQWFVANEKPLSEAVLAEGFTDETLALFHRVVASWNATLDSPDESSGMPTVLRRFISNAGGGESAALGTVVIDGTPGNPDPAKLATLHRRMGAEKGVSLAAWETLGQALSSRVRQDITREMLPLIAVLLLMLALAYRNWRDLILSVLLLGLGVAALMATMVLIGQSWNLASLAALPLLLGTGIDYGIHTLLAMRREKNDIRRMRNTTGRAVFFCGATTVIGFMSLVVADNRGVASLGIACAVGTMWILLLVLWLLPHWRRWMGEGRLGDNETIGQ